MSDLVVPWKEIHRDLIITESKYREYQGSLEDRRRKRYLSPEHLKLLELIIEIEETYPEVTK